MNADPLSPTQIWKTVLDQLRIDIPANSFNNWLRDTWGLSLEDNVFTVGTTDQAVRDLLESRLTNSVGHLLSGLLDQMVNVRFVVGEDPIEGEPEGEGWNEMDDPGIDTPKVTTLLAEYKSVYDEIVQPDQVIVFPGYFLRYIPYLGQELAWIYIGFRQAAYEAGAGRKPGKKFAASARKIARYAGMSMRNYWRWIAKPGTWNLLRSLVEPVEEDPRWSRGLDGRPHRSTNTYRVSLTIPLAPFDELALRAWFYSRLAEGRSPLEAIRMALAAPVSELLPLPEVIHTPDEVTHEPHTVQEFLSSMFDPIAEKDQKVFHELANKLAHHLMPSNDLVFLTHYFVEHWLPRLGSGSGWFVTLLRDRCFLNQRTGEIRDEVWIEHGYAEAAFILGVKRDKTIWEWLRDDDVKTFVKEIDHEGGRWETSARLFKVCLGEPMIPEDQERASRSLAERAPGEDDTHKPGEGHVSPQEPENPPQSPRGGSPGVNDTHREPPIGPEIGGSGALLSGNTNRRGAKSSDTGSPDAQYREDTPLAGGRGTHSTGANSPWIDGHGKPTDKRGKSVDDFGSNHGKSDPPLGVGDNHRAGGRDRPVGGRDIHISGAGGVSRGETFTNRWQEWHSLKFFNT